MRTDQLIAELAASDPPRTRPGLRVACAIAAGWLVALVGLAMVEGPPMAAVAHTGAAAFATKLSYSLALAVLSVIAAVAAGQPGRNASGSIALIAVPVVLLFGVAVIELTSSDRSAWNSSPASNTGCAARGRPVRERAALACAGDADRPVWRLVQSGPSGA